MKAILVDPTSPENLELFRRLAPELEIVAPQTADDSELFALLKGTRALVTRRRTIDAELLAKAPSSLEFIQLQSTRSDKVDLKAAHAAGITVATMPQRGCIAVAELALLLMLGLSKKIVRADHETRTGGYRQLGIEPELTSERKHGFQWMKLPDLFELNGKTLGLVGFGEIATEVARRARAFSMNVLYTKRERLPGDVEHEEGVEYRSFDALLRESDFVSLHVPHTRQTERMIDTTALHKMRPNAYLINTCRGGVVDEAALANFLSEGKIAGAGLDVFIEEPVPHDNPLLGLDNVLLAPHIGGGSGGARIKQAKDVMENLQRAARGEKPLHLVDCAPIPAGR